MPVTHEILGPTLVLRMIGEYEPTEIRSTLTDALRTVPAGVLRGILFDVSQSASLRRRDARAVRAMASFLAHVALQQRLRIALVGATDLAFGLMRLGAADLESAGVTAYVFRTEADAARWLAAS